MDAIFVQTCRCEDSIPSHVQLKCSFDVFMEGKCGKCTSPEFEPEVVDDPRLNTFPVAELAKMWSRCVRNVETLPLKIAAQHKVIEEFAPMLSATLGALGRKSSMYTSVEPSCGENPLGAVLTEIAYKFANDPMHGGIAGKHVKVKALDGELDLVQAFVSVGAFVGRQVPKQVRVPVVPVSQPPQ
jgi:hypothetical protein